MFAPLVVPLMIAAALSDGPPPPITVSLNNAGQYNRGEYAKVQFKAAADGYVVVLQADQDGRVRILFPLDPTDDYFIRGGKNYQIIGRDGKGSFYLAQAGGGGMVYAAWSASPFAFAGFTRGDHWDFDVLDRFNASEDPEATLNDLVGQMTSVAFDYAIDRYITYSVADYSSEGTTTYVGVSGWPWPTYYSAGWSVSFGFGCCYYDPWPWYGYGWYPAYGYYPWYGYGYPPYYGYPGYGYPGYGYPQYGYGYGAYSRPPGYYSAAGYYRPYTFKPGGTVTDPGIPYRPRGGLQGSQAGASQAGDFRRRVGEGGSPLAMGRQGSDAATITGRSEPGRRLAAGPSPQSGGSRAVRGTTTGSGSGAGTPNITPRRPSVGSAGGSVTPTSSPRPRRSSVGTDAVSPSPRPHAQPSAEGTTTRARGWEPNGTRRAPSAAQPRPQGNPGRGISGGAGGSASPERRSPSGGQARDGGRAISGGSGSRPSPNIAPPQRSGGGSPNGGGMRAGGGGGAPRAAAPSGGGGGGAARGGAPSGGGGGGGRRGR